MEMCALDQMGNEVVKGGGIACQAYISAVIDYQNMLRSMDVDYSVNFCIPETVSLMEIQKTVMAYFLQYNKLHRKFVAAPGVALALSVAYPCKNKKNPKN